MKIRHIGGWLIASFLGMTLTSCLNEPTNETSFSIRVNNLIIPDDLADPVTFNQNCSYGLKVDAVKNRLTVSTTGLILNGSAQSFTSNDMDALVLSGYGHESASFARGTAKLSNGGEVTGINGYYTTMVNYYEIENDPFPVALVNPMLVMNYKVPGATVKTFSADSYFIGNTVTTYSLGPDGEKSFTTGEAVYRVKFSSDMTKADVGIYNVQFAEEMKVKLKAVLLKGLPVTLTREGFRIQAADVTPEMLESGALTPVPRYVFNDILIETSNSDLTGIRCRYTVAGSFHGRFEGVSASKFQTAG